MEESLKNPADLRSNTRNTWTLPVLSATPEEEWDQMLHFLNLTPAEKEAMLATVEPLLASSAQFVIDNYEYLATFPETAEILGWENGVDEHHLAERRRFFAVWVARLLGLDLSHELARYLYKAGQKHAGHGPRKTHVPPVYVTGATGHTLTYFAKVLKEKMPADPQVPTALAGWNKLLNLHLHLMLSGYQSAVALSSGNITIPVKLFARMRDSLQTDQLAIHVDEGSSILILLQKFFNYFPQSRALALTHEWISSEKEDSSGNPWMTVDRVFKPKEGWRVLLDGQEIAYLPMSHWILHEGSQVQIFPPGR